MPVNRLSFAAREKSPWLQHVDETIRKYPSLTTYQAALKKASQTYSKGEGKSKKTKPKKAKSKKPVMPKTKRPSKSARGKIKSKKGHFAFPLDF